MNWVSGGVHFLFLFFWNDTRSLWSSVYIICHIERRRKKECQIHLLVWRQAARSRKLPLELGSIQRAPVRVLPVKTRLLGPGTFVIFVIVWGQRDWGQEKCCTAWWAQTYLCLVLVLLLSFPSQRKQTKTSLCQRQSPGSQKKKRDCRYFSCTWRIRFVLSKSMSTKIKTPHSSM